MKDLHHSGILRKMIGNPEKLLSSINNDGAKAKASCAFPTNAAKPSKALYTIPTSVFVNKFQVYFVNNNLNWKDRAKK